MEELKYYFEPADIDEIIEKISRIVWEHERGFITSETEDLLLEIQGDLENLVGVEV